MAEPSNPMEITQYDVKELAKKLERWSNELPPEEKAVLAAMLAEASGIVGRKQHAAPPLLNSPFR